MTDESPIAQLLEQAESCLDKGDLAQARRLYAEFCRAKDDDSRAWLMLGVVNAELGNIGVARSALERAVAVDSKNAEAHLALAHLFKTKAELAEALTSASRAVEADASFVDGWLFVAAIAGQLADWQRAEDACNHAIAIAPDRKEAHVNLGNVLLATGRASLAEEAFRKALTLNEIAEAWYGLGMALGALDRHVEAEPALATAARLDTRSAEFRGALATCLERLGRSAESAAVRAESGHL